jgi:hypothetical protein
VNVYAIKGQVLSTTAGIVPARILKVIEVNIDNQIGEGTSSTKRHLMVKAY